MKKILLASGVIASLMAVSCVKEDAFHAPQQEAEGTRIEFVGESYDDATKVSIGEKENGTYPLLWQEGDVISVWSKNLAAADLPTVDEEGNPVPGAAGKIIGEQAELFGETAGYARGTFTTINPIKVTAATDVVITYPGTVTYVDGKVSGTIPAVQTQRGANSSFHVGNAALAFAQSTLSTADKDAVSFALSQKTAFVKLVLSTSAYSSMNLTGAKLYSPGAVLAGKAVYDIAAGAMTLTETSDNVGAKFRSPVSFSGTQNVYFTAAPCDLTGKECYVVISMSDATKTVTIPAKVTGGKLEAGKLSVITVSNISEATNQCDWYEPVETRYIAGYGEGWAYSAQNCYVAYFGADGAFGEAVTFDVKARGNFTACRKPAKVVPYAACEQNASNKNNLQINDVVCHDGTNYLATTLGNDYTITVKAKQAGTYTGYSSKLLVLDENDKTLWAINVWGNKEPLKEQTYLNGIMLDRNIGQSNHEAGAGEGYHGGSFFQWGRPFTNGWSSSGGLFNKDDANGKNIGFAESAARPDVFFYNADSPTKQNWYTAANSNSMNDLWGNENMTGEDVTSTAGTKSIFDPCPKGYMVASPKIAEEIMASAAPMYTDVDADGKNRVGGKHNWLVYTLPDNSKALYDFAGCKWGNTAGNPNNNLLDIAAIWSNSNGKDEGRAYNMMFRWKDQPTDKKGWTKVSYRALGFPVRCMKDTENR